MARRNAEKPERSPLAPPPQNNLARAAEMAFDALDGQTEEQFRWLGAEPSGSAWRLPVLEDTLETDLSARRITTSAGREVGLHWSILVLHYLGIGGRPEKRSPETTFADLPAARSYSSVYQGRVISRLCATAGRDAERLRIAAAGLAAQPIGAGDLGFDFNVFPQICLRLIWHAPDEEFPPSATLLLPRNIEEYLCSEDVVVLSECLVARLGGRPF